MTIKLVVVRPFATHAKGDVITDDTAISTILAGESAGSVVRVAATTAAGG